MTHKFRNQNLNRIVHMFALLLLFWLCLSVLGQDLRLSDTVNVQEYLKEDVDLEEILLPSTVERDIMVDSDASLPADIIADASLPADIIVDASLPADLIIDASLSADIIADASLPADIIVDASLPADLIIDASLPADIIVDASLPADLIIDASLSAEVIVDASLPADIIVDASLPAEVIVDASLPADLTVDASLPFDAAIDTSLQSDMIVDVESSSESIEEVDTLLADDHNEAIDIAAAIDVSSSANIDILIDDDEQGVVNNVIFHEDFGSSEEFLEQCITENAFIFQLNQEKLELFNTNIKLSGENQHFYDILKKHNIANPDALDSLLAATAIASTQVVTESPGATCDPCPALTCPVCAACPTHECPHLPSSNGPSGSDELVKQNELLRDKLETYEIKVKLSKNDQAIAEVLRSLTHVFTHSLTCCFNRLIIKIASYNQRQICWN